MFTNTARNTTVSAHSRHPAVARAKAYATKAGADGAKEAPTSENPSVAEVGQATAVLYTQLKLVVDPTLLTISTVDAALKEMAKKDAPNLKDIGYDSLNRAVSMRRKDLDALNDAMKVIDRFVAKFGKPSASTTN